MLTICLQCNFSLEFPEILSHDHICYHRLSIWDFQNHALWDTHALLALWCTAWLSKCLITYEGGFGVKPLRRGMRFKLEDKGLFHITISYRWPISVSHQNWLWCSITSHKVTQHTVWQWCYRFSQVIHSPHITERIPNTRYKSNLQCHILIIC